MRLKTPGAPPGSQTGENKMGVMSEGRLLLNMALPLMASMLVQALYNIVDSAYVSHIADGGNALTALSLAFPIQNMIVGFGGGVAIGVNSLLSRSLGAGDREKANYAAGNGVVLSALVSLLFVVFGVFFSRPFFAAQSENPGTIESGAVYASICCILVGGVFFEFLFERMLQATGRTFLTMITQGTGAVINIILDPILIFGLGPIPAMGVAGAAIATVIGQWTAAGLALLFNLKRNPDVRFGKKYFRLQKDAVKQILTVGVPTTVMMAIGSVMNFGMNQIFQRMDPEETATSVFGVYYKLQSFFFMPVFGINNATISILAYNYGAGRPERMTKTLRLSILSAAAIMLAGTLTFQFAPHLLLSIFKTDGRFLEMGITALRVISIHFPVAAVCIILGATFQAVGIGVYSTITSLCRQLVALLPAALLLSLTGEVRFVWWAFPIAECISLLVSLLLFLRVYRKKIRPLKKEPESEDSVTSAPHTSAM
ncbi:MAG: MATE family efflux transporter [Clostridia bacterium]|nr:MATE family efflux transporter [Clostridia bacterium]